MEHTGEMEATQGSEGRGRSISVLSEKNSVGKCRQVFNNLTNLAKKETSTS